jgi:hypothetical protein
MISTIQTININTPSNIKFDLDKYTLFTGNSLYNKSYILDCLWFAITQTWPQDINKKIFTGAPLLPIIKKEKASITISEDGIIKKNIFNKNTQNWKTTKTNNGLCFYILKDGSIACYDSIRNNMRQMPKAFVFSELEILNGIYNNGIPIVNGLIRDWGDWQKSNNNEFISLKEVLNNLFPEDIKIIPSNLTRININDVRDIPTLQLPNDQIVSLLSVSNRVKRMTYLVYILVWAWLEHLEVASLINEKPEYKVTFLIDEIESHFISEHQETIISNLTTTIKKLIKNAEVQIICTTQSSEIIQSTNKEVIHHTLN